MSAHRRSFRFITATLIPLITSCGVNTDALPDPVAFAAANAPDLVPDASIELASLEPGAVVDSLDTLDGCWASARVEVDGSVSLLDVLLFDAETQTYARWRAGPDQSGFVRVDNGGEGAYVANSEGSIQLSESLGFSRNLFTGVLERVAIEPPIQMEVNVSIDGDHMLFERVEPGIELDVDPDLFFLLYRRFDCPLPS